MEVSGTSERLLFDRRSNLYNKRQQNASVNGAEALCVGVHMYTCVPCVCVYVHVLSLCVSLCKCAMHLYLSSNMKINFLEIKIRAQET